MSARPNTIKELPAMLLMSLLIDAFNLLINLILGHAPWTRTPEKWQISHKGRYWYTIALHNIMHHWDGRV